MEINAANLAWHKIFCEKPSSVSKKLDGKKSASCLQKKYAILNKKAIYKVRNETIQRYVPVKYPLKAVTFQT